MNFKRIGVSLLAVFIVAAVASAQTKEFNKGGFYLTPQFGLASWGGSLPFGVNGEYALNENIGVGGTVMVQMWSETYWSESLIGLSAEANYHLTDFVAKSNLKKVDLYVGAGLGYSIYSWKWKIGYGDWLTGSTGSSGLILEPIVGGRYYFSPKIGICVRLVGSIVGSYTGFGGTIGVTFSLK